ncbi:MAG: peptide chain release factor 3 [Hydrogenophilus sp.]|nr:peptide chain release factor 3 [Hydrogenophilus sp.]
MDRFDAIARRRTFAIIAHPDAGKTTLTEKLLLFGGAIQIAGAIKARKAARHVTSDWLAVEQARGISVTTSVMQFEYGGCLLNLLDTPGHQDFSEDTYRTLTAVDAAIMVIDAAKGVEAQTIKLLEVCRLRATPILTFINKLDRDARDPFDLITEIEDILAISVAPITLPIGMGNTFRGVFHLLQERVYCFAPGHNRRVAFEAIVGLDNPELARRFPNEIAKLRDDLLLAREALPPFDLESFWAGTQTPLFFGSAIHNFGVQELLDALIAWAPPPQPRPARERLVAPHEPAFTGFIFKIQANLDPKHRDRMAFLRICSGRYTNGMKVWHTRLGRELRLTNAVTFLADRRTIEAEAYPGDIIGIPNHGQFQIGDTLTEGEALQFTGIPYFAPELFRRARLRDPLRSKQLRRGLTELSEEGAIQLFENEAGELILGAVGPLQFEIVAERLRSEYQVDADFEPVAIHTVRWLRFPDETTRARFVREQSGRLGRDVDGNWVFLAFNRYSLEIVLEKYPTVQFCATREHRELL